MTATNDLKTLALSFKSDLEVHGETTALLTQATKLLDDCTQPAEIFADPKARQYFFEEALRDIVLTLAKQTSFARAEVPPCLW